MSGTYYLTQERLEELRRELESLKTEKRIEIADRLKNAKEYGDLSENSEYTEARNEQTQVEQRIFELEEMFKQAVVITKAKGSGEVQVGSVVSFKKGGQVFKYEIVGSNETKPEEGKISNESPLGRMLLNHKVGDSIDVDTPSGKVSYQITQIE